MWSKPRSRSGKYGVYFLALLLLRQTRGPSGGVEIYYAAVERGPWALIEGQKGQKEHTEAFCGRDARRGSGGNSG